MGNNLTSLNERTDCYDFVVDITSIEDVQNGWPIYLSPSLFQQALNTQAPHRETSLIQNQEKTVVAVLGLFNRGKTHLVNKLAGIKLPSDKKLHTKGLSFLDTKSNLSNVIMLDTAGTNAPLGRSKMSDEEKALVQKRATEMFLQELAFAFADILLVVVNELTWPDQEYLKTLKQKLVESDKEYKQLFVVHNFADVPSEKDLLHLWRKYVISCQTGTVVTQQLANKKEAIYFKEQSDGAIIFHFFLAQEGSDAGNIWNPRTYDLLTSFIAGRVVKGKPPFIEQILAKTLESLRIYCKNPTEINVEWIGGEKSVERKSERQPDPVKTTYVDGKEVVAPEEWSIQRVVEEPCFKGDFKISAKGDISLKADKVDFDGFRILLTRRDSDFQPKYDVVRTDSGISVMVDLPGFSFDSLQDPSVLTQSIEFVEDAPTRKGKISRLIISGTRKIGLLNYQRGSLTPQPIPYNTQDKEIKYDVNIANAQQAKEDKNLLEILQATDPNRKREASPFKIFINLPQDISDNIADALITIADGVYYLWLPKKMFDTNSAKVVTLQSPLKF